MLAIAHGDTCNVVNKRQAPYQLEIEIHYFVSAEGNYSLVFG